MHTRHALAILVLTSVLILGTTPALSADPGPQMQMVSGYHVALTLPAGPAQTQSTDLVITLHDSAGAPVANATVTAAVLAYRGESDPHAAESHTASETTEHSADSHAASETTAHTHDGAASEGHGAEMIPVLLEPGTEPGTYRGPLFFTEPGVATVTVAFTIDGQDRAALFSIPVAPARPRGLILGTFAAINMLAITGAAILKWRTPHKIRSTTTTSSTKRPTDRTTSAPTQEGDRA